MNISRILFGRNIVSPLLWKAFHLASLCHWSYPFPLKWDPLKLKFNENPATWQVKAWILTALVTVVGIGNLFCPYLFLVTATKASEEAYTTAYILLIVATLSIVSGQGSLTIGFYKKELTLFFNSMMELGRKEIQSNHLYKISMMDHFIGAVVIWITFIFAIFPYTAIPVAVYAKMDAGSYFFSTHFPHLFSFVQSSYTLLIPFNLIVGSIQVVTLIIAAQTYAFILLYMTTALLIYSQLFSIFNSLPQLENRVRAYQFFYFLHQIYAAPAYIFSGASLSAGFILTIMLAIVGLEGYDKFPLLIYVYSELTEVTILVLVYILLPATFQVYEKSKFMIRNGWKRELIKVTRKRRILLYRQLNALKPVYFGYYKLLQVTRNWSVQYVYNMVDSTAGFCLSSTL